MLLMAMQSKWVKRAHGIAAKIKRIAMEREKERREKEEKKLCMMRKKKKIYKRIKKKKK